MAINRFFRRWQQNVTRCGSACLPRLLIMLFISVGITGCASIPDTRQVKQFLGLEQPFAHNDIPPPSTLQGFVAQQGLGFTHQIVFREPQTGQQHIIEDPARIAEVVRLLRYGPGQPYAATAQLTEVLQVELVIGPPDHTVTAIFTPGHDTLVLFNVPTPAWPDHMVAHYQVDPMLGTALLTTLTRPSGPAVEENQ